MVGKIYSYDEFMSKILKKHVYQLISIPDNNQIDNKKADFIYCRTSSKDFKNHNKLINSGFDIIYVKPMFIIIVLTGLLIGIYSIKVFEVLLLQKK